MTIAKRAIQGGILASAVLVLCPLTWPVSSSSGPARAAVSAPSITIVDAGAVPTAPASETRMSGAVYAESPAPVSVQPVTGGTPRRYFQPRTPGVLGAGGPRSHPGGTVVTPPAPYTLDEVIADIIAAYPTAKPVSDGGDCVLTNWGGWTKGSTPISPYWARIGSGGWPGYIAGTDETEGSVQWYACYAS